MYVFDAHCVRYRTLFDETIIINVHIFNALRVWRGICWYKYVLILILVLISVVVATPISWVIMNKWLANYAYRTDIPWWLFVVVGCVCLSIALLTVGFQAIKTATANPVKAIKSE